MNMELHFSQRITFALIRILEQWSTSFILGFAYLVHTVLCECAILVEKYINKYTKTHTFREDPEMLTLLLMKCLSAFM